MNKFQNVVNWLGENNEWFFSGLGVFALSSIFSFLAFIVVRHRNRPEGKLEVVDISFNESGLPSDDYPMWWVMCKGVEIDIKLQNSGKRTVFIKEIQIDVLKSWKLNDFPYIGAPVEESASYDAVLPTEKLPNKVILKISHAIRSNEVDRISLNIEPDKSHTIVLFKLAFVYGKENAVSSSENLIVGTRYRPTTYPVLPERVVLENGEDLLNVPQDKNHLIWKYCEPLIAENRRIRDEIEKIDALANEVVASFMDGEPIEQWRKPEALT